MSVVGQTDRNGCKNVRLTSGCKGQQKNHDGCQATTRPHFQTSRQFPLPFLAMQNAESRSFEFSLYEKQSVSQFTDVVKPIEQLIQYQLLSSSERSDYYKVTPLARSVAANQRSKSTVRRSGTLQRAMKPSGHLAPRLYVVECSLVDDNKNDDEINIYIYIYIYIYAIF